MSIFIYKWGRNILKKILLFLQSFIFLPLMSYATTSFDKPVKTMAFINGSLMAVPIMPIQFETKAGTKKLSLRPASFSADSGLQTYEGARWMSKFEGQGLAFMYHWQMSNRIGSYFLAMYNQLNSGEFLGRGSDPSDPLQDVKSLDVKANFLQASAGLTYQIFNGSVFSMQLIAGPTFTKAEAEQRVLQEDPSDPDEYTMNLSPSITGALVGVQLGFKIFNGLAINPFFMMSSPMGETCVPYTLKIIQSGDQTGLSDPECTVSGNETKLQYDTSFKTVGLNILFPQWGLSFNILTELDEIQGIEGTEPKLIFVTWTL